MLEPAAEPNPWEEFAPVAQEDNPIPEQVVQAPRSTSDKLALALQGAKLFNSATTAMATKDQGIGRNPDGSWDLPLMASNDGGLIDTIGGIATAVGQKLGARGTAAGPLIDTEAIQNTFHKFQQDNNLSDEEVQGAWNDLGNINRPWEKDEVARVQSDGSILPGMENKVWLDEASALKAIDGAEGASAASKLQMRANLPKVMSAVASAKLEAYSAAAVAIDFSKKGMNMGGPAGAGNLIAGGFQSPEEWAKDNSRQGDFGTPAFVRDYEKANIDDKNDLKQWIWGMSASATKGTMKLASTVAGIAGFAGIESAGEAGAQVQEAQSMVTAGAPDAGLPGALLEETPSLIAQIAITRGIGMGVTALGAAPSLVTKVATAGAIATAGLQSAGSQYSQEISQGTSPEEAREKALKAGVATAVITGIFQVAGAGGVEKVAAGKPLGDITMRELYASIGTKELIPKVRIFASEVLKASIGEASEEGIDQLTNAFLTADPDTNLASAWEDAEHAATIGGFIGGAVHIGSMALEGGTEAEPNGTTPDAALAPAAVAARVAPVLPQVAATMRTLTVNAPLAPAPAAVLPGDAPNPVTTMDVAGFKVQTPDGTGAGLAETVFGKPDAKNIYDPQLDPKAFDIVKIPGSTNMAVTYEGKVTDRAYDPLTGTFKEMDAPTLGVLTKRQEGIPKRGTTLLIPKPKDPESEAVTAPAATLDEDVADEIPGLGEQIVGEVPISGTPPLASTQPIQTNEQNPQGQSGLQGEIAAQVPVSPLPVGEAAQPDPQPAGELPAAAAPTQAQAEAPVDDDIIPPVAQRPMSVGEEDFLNSPATPFTVSDDRASVAISEDSLKALVKPSKAAAKGAETLDSGTTPGTIGEPLPLGSVVNGTNATGAIVSQRVVALTEPLPDGGVRHYLSPVLQVESKAKEALPARIASYAPTDNTLVVEPAKAMARRVVELKAKGQLKTSGPELLDSTEKIISAQLASISSDAFVAGHVSFGSIPGSAMRVQEKDGKPHITANTEHFARVLVDATRKMDPANTVALDFMARDFAEKVAMTGFEETAHWVGWNAIPRDGLIGAMRQMVELSNESPALKKELLKQARWRQAASGPSALSDQQVMDGLSSPDSDDELFAIGHELLANLIQRLRTGHDSASIHANFNRWIKLFTPPVGGKSIGRIQTLALRLTEMANRMMEAINRFYQAHRLLNALPPKLAEYARVLDEAMGKQGFTAPDTTQVQTAAFRAAKDTMAHAPALALMGREEAITKRELRGVLDKLRQARGDTSWLPVTLNPITGVLVPAHDADPDEQAQVEPFLRTLNTTSRMDTVLRATSMARDLSTVLRHLNSGKAIVAGSKILDTFDPARLGQSAGHILERLDSSLVAASGLGTEQALVESVNSSLFDQLMATNGIVQQGNESLFTLFATGGAAFDNIEGRNLVKAVADAERAVALDRSDEALMDTVVASRQAFSEFVARESAGTTTLAGILRTMTANNQRAMDNALRAMKSRQTSHRPVSDLRNLVARYASHSEVVLAALSRSGLDRIKMQGALERAAETNEALRRLNDFPAELEYLVAGGRMPRSMRNQIPTWTALNAEGLDRNLRLAPLALARTLRPGNLNSKAQIREGVRGQLPEFSGSVDLTETAFGTLSFTFEPSAVFNGFKGVVPVTMSNGELGLPEGFYEPALNSMAHELREGARVASRLLGVEARNNKDAEDKTIPGNIITNTLYANAAAINATLSANLAEAFWRNEPEATEEAVLAAGFALPIEQTGDNTFGAYRPMDIVSPVDKDVLDFSLKGKDHAANIVSSGALGDLVVKVGRFLNSMERVSDAYTAPLLSTSSGLTPAGLAYQLLAAKHVELLALTKGGLTNKMLEAFPEANEFYLRLAPGLEDSAAFKEPRSALVSDPGSLAGYFWDLQRLTKVANSIYSDSLRMMNDQANLRKELAGATRDIPVSLAAMQTIAFEMGLRQRSAHDVGDTRIALLHTVPATRFLEELDSLEAEHQMMVGKTFDEFGDVESYGLQASESGDASGRIEAAEFNQQRVDAEARNAEWIAIRRDNWRSAALMALFGGDTDTVMRYIHSQSFTSMTVENGEPKLQYHTELLNQAIREKLVALQAEEIARGVVKATDGATHDSALREVMGRNPEHTATLESLLHSGGRVSTEIPASVEGSPSAFEADTRSLMDAVSSLIPNLSIIEGNARWEGSLDSGSATGTSEALKSGARPQTKAEQDRVAMNDLVSDVHGRATISFIPDASAPIIALPFGNRVTVEERDVREALVGMLDWLSEYGGVDLSAQAMKIVQVMAANPLDADLRATLSKHFSDTLTLDGRDLDEHGDAIIASTAKAWSEVAQRGIELALSKVNDPADDYLNPERAAYLVESGQSIDPKNASRLIALALTQPQARKALVLSMRVEPQMSHPSPEAVAKRGDLIGLSRLPGAVDNIAFDQLSNLPEGFSITDERGVVVTPEEDTFENAAMAQAWAMAEEGAADLDVEPTALIQELSEQGASPILHLQSEWASRLLHGVLDGLEPSVPPTVAGLIPSTPEPARLTEMESRQLMGMMDTHPLKEVINAEAPRPAPVWNGVAGEDTVSATALMNLSGRAAQTLREKYSAIKPFVKDNELSEDRHFNYRTFAFTDILDPDGVNYDVYHQSRVRKGQLAVAERLGAIFVQTPESGLGFGTLEANSKRLEALDMDSGRMMLVDAPEGPLSVWQAERDLYAKETAAFAADVRRMQDELVAAEQRSLASHAALEAVQGLSGELVGIHDAQALLEAMRATGRIDVGSGSMLDAEPVVNQFFRDREAMASAMAQSLVDNFKDGMRDLQRTLPLENLAGVAKSPVATHLTLLSIRHTRDVQRHADTLATTAKSLHAMEAGLAPRQARTPTGRGAPSWYDTDITRTQRRTLMAMRRALNEARINLNGIVATVERQVNMLIPRMMDANDYLIDPANTDNAQRASRFLDLLSDLRGKESLFRRAVDAQVENALIQSQWFDPSHGLSSMDLSQLAYGRRVEIPEDAQEQIRQALLQPDPLEAVTAILNQAIFPAEETVRGAHALMEAKLRESRHDATNPEAMMRVFALSNEVHELQQLDPRTRHKVVLSVLRQAAEQGVNVDERRVETLLRERAASEASYARRQHTIYAPRHNGNNLLTLTGSPEEIVITSRVMARYGEQWSRNYLSRRGLSSHLSGWDDARSGAQDADAMMQLGADAMTAATGRDWGVTGNWVAPVASTQAGLKPPSLSSPILPSVVPSSTVTTRAKLLTKELEDAGVFGKPIAAAASALGRNDPFPMVRARANNSLALVMAVEESGLGKTLGSTLLPDGTMTPNLHVRLESFLNDLKTAPKDVIGQLKALHDEAYAALMADAVLDDMVAGFVPGQMFNNKVIKGLLNHDPALRALFSKTIEGWAAANKPMAVIESGAHGNAGREGHTSMKDANARVFKAEMEKVTGKNKFEKLAYGCFLAQVNGYLQKGHAGSHSARAKGLLRMLDQADEGILAALMHQAPPYTDGHLMKDIVSWPLNRLKEVKNYFTEETYQLLEERATYTKLRDDFKPFIANIAAGASLDGQVAAMKDMMFTVLGDHQARGWDAFLRTHLSHMSQAVIAQARLQGMDVSRLERLPAVPFRWQTFNREFHESAPTPTLKESLALDHAMWAQSPNRTVKPGEIHMLHINGAEAPLHIMNDLIYRLNVSPEYDTFAAVVGVAEHVGKSLVASGKGELERLSEERYGAAANTGISATRVVALLGQEILHKDHTSLAPKNIGMDVVHKFQQQGAVRALISCKQIWSQTLPGAIAYSMVRDGLGSNLDFPALYTKYLFGKTIGRLGRSIDPTGMMANAAQFSANVDAYVLRNLPNVYARTADGNQDYFNTSGRIKPSVRPKGRVTGALRPAADLVVRPLGFVHENALQRLPNWMLHFVLAKPEATMTRTIALHSLVKQLNARNIPMGEEPVSVEEIIQPGTNFSITPDMFQNASRAVTDMMAPTDGSKKASIFQQTDTITGEVLRGMITMFANHQVHMSGQTYGAHVMLRNGDAKTKQEARRIIASGLGQNTLFQVLKYETVGLTLAHIVGGLAGWDDEKKQEFYGRLYGIEPGQSEEERRTRLAHWTALLAFGSANPIGYDAKVGEWSDEERGKDLKQVGLALSKELVNQSPWGGVGMMASTAIGSSMSEFLLKHSVMHLLPGELGHYERAGLVIPERWGGTGDGPNAHGDGSFIKGIVPALERAAYNSSQMFLSDIASRSTLTGGIASLVDPLAQISNSPDEVSLLDTSLIWLSQFPGMPRELRGVAQKSFQQSTDASIWDSSWKK